LPGSKGRLIARLVSVDVTSGRALGRDRGKFTLPDDFNAPLHPILLEEFGA
jgi:hypothetical protein